MDGDWPVWKLLAVMVAYTAASACLLFPLIVWAQAGAGN